MFVAEGETVLIEGAKMFIFLPENGSNFFSCWLSGVISVQLKQKLFSFSFESIFRRVVGWETVFLHYLLIVFRVRYDSRQVHCTKLTFGRFLHVLRICHETHTLF
jgi:hypothetical protein